MNPEEDLISILLEHIEASTITIEDSEELIQRSRKSIKYDIEEIKKYYKIINERKALSSSLNNKKEKITKAIFNFKNEEGKEWIKEEFYSSEFVKVKMLEERAYTWLKDAEIVTGKHVWRNDMVFTLNRRRIDFRKGMLFITHEVIE